MPGKAALAAILSAAIVLSGCGRTPAKPKPGPQIAAAPSSAVPAPTGAAPASLPPPPAPEADHRPDNVKLEDDIGRLRALQDQLIAADGQLITQARAALQSGSQDQAHAAISRYLAAIETQTAATPAPPKVTDCYAKALHPLKEASDALAEERSSRTQQAQALLKINYRPLALPDLAPLVPGAAPDAKAQALGSALTRAKTQTDSCRLASAAAKPVRTRVQIAAPPTNPGPTPPAATAPSPETSSPQPPQVTESLPPASSAPTLQPHKSFLGRLFGGKQPQQ